MRSIEHIDNGQLLYFIYEKDVQFIKYCNMDDECFIQAKLLAKPDDESGLKAGYVDTRVWLYPISDDEKTSQKTGHVTNLEPSHTLDFMLS